MSFVPKCKRIIDLFAISGTFPCLIRTNILLIFAPGYDMTRVIAHIFLDAITKEKVLVFHINSWVVIIVQELLDSPVAKNICPPPLGVLEC